MGNLQEAMLSRPDLQITGVAVAPSEPHRHAMGVDTAGGALRKGTTAINSTTPWQGGQRRAVDGSTTEAANGPGQSVLSSSSNSGGMTSNAFQEGIWRAEGGGTMLPVIFPGGPRTAVTAATGRRPRTKAAVIPTTTPSRITRTGGLNGAEGIVMPRATAAV